MSENKNQSNEENHKSNLPEDAQPTAEEAAEQLKGSDADVDRSVGFDDQPDLEETKEQLKDTDADSAS